MLANEEVAAIVGGGVSGFAAANRALALGADVHAFEAGGRLGGLVHTERTEDGLLLEHGPDSIATMKPGALEAMKLLGLGEELIAPSAGAFVLQGERLRPLPAGLLAMRPGVGWQMMRSALFTPWAKLRFVVEPLIPTRGCDADESVASFFERRFGRELVERLIDPLLGGIYGAPTDQLSMRAVMPRLAEAEERDGSLSRGMLQSLSIRRRGGREAPPPPVRGLRRGMGQLIETLARDLSGRVALRQPVLGVRRRAGRYDLTLADGGRVPFDRVIVAVPAWRAARMVEELDRELASELSAVESTRVDSVTLVWRRDEIPRLDAGTGFVVPRAQRRSLAACTVVSRKWPGRAPEDTVVLRVFLRARASLTGRGVVELARRELRDVVGIDAAPRRTRVFRRRRALPRYGVGHRDRVAAMREREAGLPGFALAGNAFDGIGIPDCLASGRAAADRVLGLEA